MVNDEQVAIVCADWSEWALMQLPGNRTAACGCGAPVVISRAGRELREANPAAEIKCFRCALREAPDAPAEPAPGVAEQVRDATGVEVEDFKGMTLAEFVDSHAEVCPECGQPRGRHRPECLVPSVLATMRARKARP
jgi:hypothetical protein